MTGKKICESYGFTHLLIGSVGIIIKALNELDIRYMNDSGDVYIKEKDYTDYKNQLAYKGVCWYEDSR